MYVTDLRKDFFDVIKSHERVLVVANFDVDSVCAVKILQWLLKCDHVTYTLVPVRGKTDLIEAFKDNVGNSNDTDGGTTVKYVVMINCGGTFDIVDFFDPPEDVVIFVADSHRPTDVCNIYSDEQVRLLMKPDEDEDVPEYDDIFKDSDDEMDDGDENDSAQANGLGENETDDDLDSNPMSKRKRFDETAILKRRERRIWEEKRTKILFEYQQFSDYGSSTAILMYELAWKMSRDTNDLLWWAIVGHTEQYLSLKTEVEKYVVGVSNIRDHVSRLNKQNEQETLAIDCMRLSFDKELNLNLYRHWAILDSLKHTIYTASQFKIWTERGKQRLSEFLAELGLPIAQCEGTFSTMDLDLRNQILTLFEEKSEKYRLDDITYGSFNATFGFRHKFCAADIVYSTLSLMEQNFVPKGSIEHGSAARSSERRQEADPANSFLEALSSLSRSSESAKILERGISLGKEQLKLVMKQVQNFINLNSIVTAGPFLYALIEDGTPDSKYFSRPNCLLLLAQFALRGYIAKSSNRNHEKLKKLPLIVSVPFDPEKGLCLVIGVPPVVDRTRKNLLGKAFEQAARKTNSRYLLDYFDPSVIQLKTEDRTKFLDGLTAILV